MDLTHTSSITYDFVAIPEADVTFQFRLKGHKDRIRVSINTNIYYTEPFSTGRISVANPGIQTVYTEREDKIHIIKMKIPQFKNYIRSCIVLSMETASSEKKVIVEDLNITDISSPIQIIQTDIHPQVSPPQTVSLPQIQQQEKTHIQQEKIKKKFMDDNYKFNVICEGLMFQNSGFAKVMRNVTFGLDKIGCRVKAISHDDVNSDILNTEKGRRINELRSNSIENPCIWITMTHPAGVQPHNSNYSIGYVMFETLEFPDNFAQNLKMQNEIWTPSNICKDSMKRSGLDNVYVMPLGVDTELFDPDKVGHPTHIRGNLSDMNGKYTFLSVMSYSERKSPTLLVRSFAEEFRGQDDVGLYLKGAWYDAQKAQNEINEEIKDISNPPLISLDFNIYPDDVLASLYKACDCFVLPTKGEGWCCLPDSPILTSNKGVQKIKDIKIGDKVLTHKGKFMKVSQVMKREYNGDIIRIIPHKFRIPINLTPEHKVLAIKTTLCTKKNGEIRESIVCSPGSCYYMKNGRQYKWCRYVYGEEPYRKYKTEWIDARELKIGDYVTYPRINDKIIDIEKIRILDYINDFLDITGDSYDDDSKQIDIFGNFIEKTIAMNQSYSKKYNRIPAEIKLTGDLMRLFGYFIAEGDISNDRHRQIEFSFNINEIEYHKDVEILMKDIFKIDTEHVIKEDNNTHTLRYSNMIIGELFKNLFIGDNEYYENKKGKGKKSHIVRIPSEFLNLPLDKLAELIKGIWRGDGGNIQKGYMIKTTSETLMHQLVYILAKFGIFSSLRIQQRDDGYFDKNRTKMTVFHSSYIIEIFGKDVDIFGKIIDDTHKYRENVNERESFYIKGNNYYYLPIKNIDIIKYNGDVWNLEIEEDNSYVSSIIVHNCLPVIEAMSMGKPAITTRWGGHLEFANNNNSYLINVEKFAPEPRCDWITPEYVRRNFAIPDKDHLRALMRHVYEHREEAKEKGIIARKHIVNNYSWEKCCDRIYNRLEEISNIK